MYLHLIELTASDVETLQTVGKRDITEEPVTVVG